MTKFRVGDQVEIVNYGAPYWDWTKGKEPVVIDLMPYLIGEVGIIAKAQTTQGQDKYSIEGIKGMTAWYDNGQLKLIIRPNYKDV
jgi:hypothetical protein